MAGTVRRYTRHEQLRVRCGRQHCARPPEVTLPDGTAALIWPLLDTDRDLLRQGFAELSTQSRQQCFLTALPELSDAMVVRLVDNVDGVDHVALLLTVLPDGAPAAPVGVARLVRYPGEPGAADVAVTVVEPGRAAVSAGP